MGTGVPSVEISRRAGEPFDELRAGSGAHGARLITATESCHRARVLVPGREGGMGFAFSAFTVDVPVLLACAAMVVRIVHQQ